MSWYPPASGLQKLTWNGVFAGSRIRWMLHGAVNVLCNGYSSQTLSLRWRSNGWEHVRGGEKLATQVMHFLSSGQEQEAEPKQSVFSDSYVCW